KIRVSPLLLVARAAACIAGISAFFIWGLPDLLGSTLGMALSPDKSGIIPRAWGINSVLSVCGIAPTRLLSTALVFSMVIMVFAALHLLAVGCFRGLRLSE